MYGLVLFVLNTKTVCVVPKVFLRLLSKTTLPFFNLTSSQALGTWCLLTLYSQPISIACGFLIMNPHIESSGLCSFV